MDPSDPPRHRVVMQSRWTYLPWCFDLVGCLVAPSPSSPPMCRRRPSLLMRLPYRCLVRDHGCGGSARGAWLLRVEVAGVELAAAPPVADGALRRDPSPGRATRVTLAPPWPPRTSTRRFAAVGGSRRRGGAVPSRFPLLLATGHSRSARAPMVPLTAGALLLGPSNLSAGLHPRGRAGTRPWSSGGTSPLPVLIFPLWP